MIDTEKIQRCGCREDDCVEILGLEDSIYACFTCGYAGVTPSGADNYEDEIHIGDLLAEVERLRKQLLKGVTYMNKTPNQTKDGRRQFAKRFEREVKEMIE